MSGYKRPSKALSDVIAGRLSVDDAPPWLRSWFSFYVYRQAVWVIESGTQQGRRKRLAAVPEPVRELVEVEARRLYQTRRKGHGNI